LFFLSKHENNAIIGLYFKLEQTSAPSRECICQISKIRTYSGSRSSKIIDLGANRKPICDLLLVINSTFYPYLLPFSRNSRLKIENCWFYQPLSFWRPLAAERH